MQYIIFSRCKWKQRKRKEGKEKEKKRKTHFFISELFINVEGEISFINWWWKLKLNLKSKRKQRGTFGDENLIVGCEIKNSRGVWNVLKIEKFSRCEHFQKFFFGEWRAEKMKKSSSACLCARLSKVSLRCWNEKSIFVSRKLVMKNCVPLTDQRKPFDYPQSRTF